MGMEKAQGLVLRVTDWSETSRIATLWTEELGKVRVLAKGGRRAKSPFENALDLLTLCSMVLLRKSHGGLDILTEAQAVQFFPGIRKNLSSLHAGYYLAELLEGWTQDHDPHPALFQTAVQALYSWSGLGESALPEEEIKARVSYVLFHFESVLLREMGFQPELDACTGCGKLAGGWPMFFSPAQGGIQCQKCVSSDRFAVKISQPAWSAWRSVKATGECELWPRPLRKDLRKVLGTYFTYLLGKRPKLLPYLESGGI
ncbi:MAG: DNA repair protein RecO [Gemmataceae bacterium]|nr:DNA repair protein RecO [Gemmataceae bacterium]